MHLAPSYQDQAARGERSAFGENWAAFLLVLEKDRIESASQSLAAMLGTDSLTGKSFLDIGTGSGLSSLVARRMGARVTPFDYDPSSVVCTQGLRWRYFHIDPDWRVEPGSALDHANINQAVFVRTRSD